MTSLRQRLPVVTILLMAAQVSTLCLSVSAVWIYTDMHHDMMPSAECHMAPTATVCPMHHGAADTDSPQSANPGAKNGSLLFRCNCSSTLSVDGLVGVAGVLTPPGVPTLNLALSGLMIVFDAAPLELGLQVSSPPPRG